MYVDQDVSLLDLAYVALGFEPIDDRDSLKRSFSSAILTCRHSVNITMTVMKFTF